MGKERWTLTVTADGTPTFVEGWRPANYGETVVAVEVVPAERTDSWRRLAEDNGSEAGRRAAEVNALRQQLQGAVGALQAILDLPCPLGREGDPLGEAQKIASAAITTLGEQ
jgi:hypothetical protein